MSIGLRSVDVPSVAPPKWATPAVAVAVRILVRSAGVTPDLPVPKLGPVRQSSRPAGP